MRLDIVDRTGSTNMLLKEMAGRMRHTAGSVPSPWALAAGYQTAGRGAGQNSWFSSEKKNILLSIYFETGLEASRQFLFNMFFSVASRDFIARFLPEVKIKWPNDIYVRDRKIAGILIEHSVRKNIIDSTVAGIGININEESFPEEIPNPTSLFLEMKTNYNVEALIREYLDTIERRLPLLESGNEEVLKDTYLKEIYRLNEKQTFASEVKSFSGIIRGVDEFGRLEVENCLDNEVKCYGFKEIKYII